MSKNKLFIISFLLPILIQGFVFVMSGIYPFGPNIALVEDFKRQYIPFLMNYVRDIQGLSISSYNWTNSTDYVSLFAYYLSSPLNLLLLPMPVLWIKGAVTFLILLKLGLSGLFMAMFLYKTSERNRVLLPLFAALYALCGFSLGSMWNIIWLDSFALLPLCILGVRSCVYEGRYKLYISSLALSIFSNFYIGLYICIFIVISFIYYCVLQRYDIKTVALKTAQLAGYSVAAVLLTAFLSLPAFFTILETAGAANSFPGIYFHHPALYLAANFLAFRPQTAFIGLPNWYTGIFGILLFSAFITNTNIVVREKILLFGIVACFMFATNFSVLDYYINGFRIPIGMPGRYSFLISFSVVTAAYKAFTHFEESNTKRDLFYMSIFAGLMLFFTWVGAASVQIITQNAVLCVVYITALALLLKTPKPQYRRAISTVIAVTVVIEIGATSAYTLKGIKLENEWREYPKNYETIKTLLEMREDSLFYRTELTEPNYSGNDNSVYGYTGISLYSSTSALELSNYLSELGFQGWKFGVTHTYVESAPLMSALLGIRYQIAPAYAADTDVFWRITGKHGDGLLLENKYWLPIGFMADTNIILYESVPGNPFINQSELFRLATGIEGELFKMLEPIKGTTFDYYIPKDGMLYIYYEATPPANAYLFVNGEFIKEFNIGLFPYMFTAGNFSAGDTVSIRSSRDLSRENVFLAAGIIDGDLFNTGYNRLTDERLELDFFSGTKFGGRITVESDGIMFLSIVYNNNWRAYVNGEKVEIIQLGAMSGVELPRGEHFVELRYFNASFLIGGIISFITLSLLIFIEFRKKKTFSNAA